jgi:hypothetical protein
MNIDPGVGVLLYAEGKTARRAARAVRVTVDTPTAPTTLAVDDHWHGACERRVKEGGAPAVDHVFVHLRFTLTERGGARSFGSDVGAERRAAVKAQARQVATSPPS